ncbi:30S ribosomal protein S9 [Candidatus Woesearchaeota archaeon]|nr:30S ribosomal protein S9 [Candidatus Woesearchaeota archaeon]
MKVINTTGKRKTAIARAVLKEGSGIIRVNSILLDNYSTDMYRTKIMEPLMLAENTSKKVNISVKVQGGGQMSQAEASRLAIARALSQFQPALKKVFLTYDRHLLVPDVRFKEAYKPNDSKARAKRQKSYR